MVTEVSVMPQANFARVLPVQGATTTKSSSSFGPMGSACAMVWMISRPAVYSIRLQKSQALPKRVSVV
jgi:hypothetical protein